MSLDEELENKVSDLLLINILNSRDDAVSTAEIWAILKETCVALKSISSENEINNLELNVNCLMIDDAGNIQINVDSGTSNNSRKSYTNEILIRSLGKSMMYIMSKYSNIDESDNLSVFINQLINVTPNNDFNISNIELYADRQLNGSSIDKQSDEYDSEFQDSFLSTEYSLNSYQDSDSEKSLTKEPDTFSCISESIFSTDSEKCFFSLSQLWNNCLERILSNDQECMVLIYAILKAVSNSLLNENNYKKCLCISIENILLDRKGKIFLNFSPTACSECQIENPHLNYYDTKYINKIGNIIFEIIRFDHRIMISSYVSLMLQRMIDSQDMIINDVLHFCKTHITLQGIKTRSVLISLFTRWKYWYNVNLRYLTRLKHKFLYDISTKNLNKFLKKVHTKSQLSMHTIFQQNPSWLSGLKYVTKISITELKNMNPSIQSPHLSAFQPYFSKTNTSNATLTNPFKSSRLRDDTHFRPLVLTSECDSVYQSQDILMSPIDVVPKYSKRALSTSRNKSNLPLQSQKTWQSVSHLPIGENFGSLNRINLKHHLSLNRKSNEKSNTPGSFALAESSRSPKINMIIEIIQSSIIINSESIDNLLNDRHVLTIADFALSLETLTENVFFEAVKQRFAHIKWLDNSLKSLYNIINDNDGTSTNNQDFTPIADLIHNSLDNKSNIHNSNETIKTSHSTLRVKTSKENVYVNSEVIPVENEGMASDCDIEDTPKHHRIVKTASVFVKKHVSVENEGMASDCDIENTPRPHRIVKTASVFVKKHVSEFSDKIKSTVNERKFSQTGSLSYSKSEKRRCQNNLEDATFYEILYPSALLCFPATATILSPDRNPVLDISINDNNIQDLLMKFFQLNQSIQFKFKELSKTIDLIEKCKDIKDKKLKKQYYNDQNDLQQSLETMFVNQMEFENLVVEYHSVGIEKITEEIKSHCGNQSIRFTNNIRNFRNLQMIQPYALVTCLFSKGAFTSGLVYEFFLIYREFYTPTEFASTLSSVFNKLQYKLSNVQLINAKFRLFFIILCWIDGFYKIDFSNIVYSKVMNLVNKYLTPYIKKCNRIIENVLNRTKNEIVSPLLCQFINQKDGNNTKGDLIRNIDIEKATITIEKNRKEKQKLILSFNLSFEKSKRISNEHIFSILDISPKDLAVCFTLMEQELFNKIHPCQLLLYIKSLSCTDESILQVIKSHRFVAQSPIVKDVSHREVLDILHLSGKITHWAISEILRTTDFKLQGKIIKVMVVTCFWCVELNNYSTAMNILEAIHSNTLKWAPFWNNVTPKTMKILKDLDDITNKFSRNSINYPLDDKRLQSSFLTGSPFLPCLHAMLVSLKLSLVGKSITKDGCLKWNKLKKISDILDQIRLYSQFKYSSNNSEIDELRKKLNARIDHLTGISLDLLQSHNMLTQES